MGSGRKKPVLTPEICRAGRALLGLKQSEFADAAGLSKVTLCYFELGERSPEPKTLESLMRAFSRAGIEIIEGGVRRKKRVLTNRAGRGRR